MAKGLISALPGIETMFLIVSKFISASSIFFLSFQGQRLQKKAIYTNDYQSVMSKFRVTLTDVKWMKATIEPDVNTGKVLKYMGGK